MKWGILAAVATIGGFFVLSKDSSNQQMASENVVFHARQWC